MIALKQVYAFSCVRTHIIDLQNFGPIFFIFTLLFLVLIWLRVPPVVALYGSLKEESDGMEGKGVSAQRLISVIIVLP